MVNVIFEFPLRWLPQQKRTKNMLRAQFGKHSPSKAGDYLVAELNRMGATQIVITSNLQKRKNGSGFYATQRVDDSGIVVYFQFKGIPKAMACDKWTLPEHNIWALYKSIEAIRGLERWGGSDFLDGLFGGFKALPPPSEESLVQEYDYFAGLTEEWTIKKRYRELCKILHPDIDSRNKEEFVIMQKQYESIKMRENGD